VAWPESRAFAKHPGELMRSYPLFRHVFQVHAVLLERGLEGAQIHLGEVASAGESEGSRCAHPLPHHHAVRLDADGGVALVGRRRAAAATARLGTVALRHMPSGNVMLLPTGTMLRWPRSFQVV